jgi:N utilization substance protein B
MGRIVAFQTIYSWEVSKNDLEVLLDFSWMDNQEKLDEKTKAFSRLLILGTIENIESVDAMIKNNLENWDFSRVGRVDLAIIRMSCYTLMYQSVPASIVIAEAIAISKMFCESGSFRFINGVLDGIRKAIEFNKV